jgi:chemotaxis signal transduction protein
MTDLAFSGLAGDLRRVFDHSFAAPAADRREDAESLLLLRSAGVSYALRLREIAALFVHRRIVPVPSSTNALLGLSGLRGQIVPVYGLRAILGHPPAAEAPRGIVLASGALVGFAFDELAGHLSTSRAEIVPAGDALERAYVREVVRASGAILPVIHIPSVIDALEQENR